MKVTTKLIIQIIYEQLQQIILQSNAGIEKKA